MFTLNTKFRKIPMKFVFCRFSVFGHIFKMAAISEFLFNLKLSLYSPLPTYKISFKSVEAFSRYGNVLNYDLLFVYIEMAAILKIFYPRCSTSNDLLSYGQVPFGSYLPSIRTPKDKFMFRRKRKKIIIIRNGAKTISPHHFVVGDLITRRG